MKMKKLMIVGAAALCAAVGFADVESANVVGYESRDLTAGAKVISGANFVTVGNDEMPLQSIKMNEDCDDSGAEIWWWNGSTYGAHAYWVTELYGDEDGEIELGYAGWGDFDYWMPINKTFAPGESFWIKANGLDATVTFAGEVAACDAATEYYGIDLSAGNKVLMTNPFPVGSFTLQSIKMNEDCDDSGAEIWWWNGSTYDAHAYWVTELYGDEDGEVELGYAGWGDFDYWMPITKTFRAGEGFWVKANGLDATIKFQNPFYKAAK